MWTAPRHWCLPQSVEQTEVALSLDFETPLPISYGDMILTWGASGIWSDTDGTGPSASVVPFDDGWRGRLDLGFRFEQRQWLENLTPTPLLTGLVMGMKAMV